METGNDMGSENMMVAQNIMGNGNLDDMKFICFPIVCDA